MRDRASGWASLVCPLAMTGNSFCHFSRQEAVSPLSEQTSACVNNARKPTANVWSSRWCWFNVVVIWTQRVEASAAATVGGSSDVSFTSFTFICIATRRENESRATQIIS